MRTESVVVVVVSRSEVIIFFLSFLVLFCHRYHVCVRALHNVIAPYVHST